MSRVPVTVLTGFLGAGKTTLLRSLLTQADGRRIAVIVNEFGDAGFDGGLVEECAAKACAPGDIIELTNGCICCTVADDFVPTMDKLLSRDRPLDAIVIETSGLALPKPLVKAFNWPEIASRGTVDGVVAVVDGAAVAAGRFADDPEAIARQRAQDPSLDHDNPLEEVYEDQLLCADLVILNKADLMSSAERHSVTGEIGKTLPRAVKVVEAENGQVPIAILLGLGAKAESDLANRPSHHDLEGEHDHDDFDTFIIDLPAFASPQALVDRMVKAAEAHDVLRMKGFVEIEGKPMRLLVQGVGSRIQHQFDRKWPSDAPRRGRLVVIGETGFDKDAIRALIQGQSALWTRPICHPERRQG